MLNNILNILRLNENKLSSITQFLKIIVEKYDSYGAILWELNPKIDYFFIAAHWFPGGTSPTMHGLSADTSNTGQAVRTETSIYIDDVTKNLLINADTTFWKTLKIKSFFIIPITFENGEKGSLNIYCNNDKGIPAEVQNEFEEYASILPCWYHSLQDRATHALINKSDKMLKIAEVSYAEIPIPKDAIKKHFKNLCREVSDTFQAFETSIFLKDPFKSADEYECIASTWEVVENQSGYTAEVTSGITGWILAKKEPVYIPDLMFFKTPMQKEIIEKQYPEIIWCPKADIQLDVAAKLGLRIEEYNKLPPMGFIGAPIFIGDKLLGVIRCCAPLKGPYYFGPKQLELLKLIATRVGEVWNNWIQRVLIQDDTNTWKSIIESTNRLDTFVLTELVKSNPDIFSIFKKVLAELPLLVKDAEILDVRLINEEKTELFFASTFGQAWDEGSPEEIQKRKEKRFSLADKTKSAGAEVFHTKQVIVFSPSDKKHPYNGTFEKTSKMILAPLMIGDDVLGVLDVRSTNPRPFQPTARHAVELMAGQLAVYHELVKSINELQTLQVRQVQTFRDFSHQVRSPIIQAKIRSKLAFQQTNNTYITPTLLKHLNATVGLCNKSNRVAKSIQLFTDLARSEPLHLDKTVITGTIMHKLLAEAAADTKVMINQERKITINIEKASTNILDKFPIEFDQNMLEQLLNVLLDNAMKYSYDNTEIHIIGGLTSRNQFQMSFINTGIPILESEIKDCKLREWRSEQARAATGEGGGIGLWILDHIMLAHGGSLIIHPTNKNGSTEIKTIFSNKHEK